MPVATSQATFHSPPSLLKQHPLPVAAYLRTPTQPPGLDLSRPILLYSHYQSTKVRATSMRLHRDSTLSLVGPSLVIPDTYSGWFSVITPEGKSAPIFSTIEEVVAGKVTFFLTRHDVAAFSVKEDESGKTSCQRITVPSGHVLKLLGVIQDLNLRQNSISNGNLVNRSSPQSSVNEEKFVQCLNFKNEIVYLPLHTRGRFYATAQKSSKNTNKVFLVPQIVKNFKLPLTVKLVCGHIPRTPCAFTGILRLERSYQEEVILACTMTSEATATLFEIEVDSNFLFRPVVDEMFSKSPIYLKTVSYCQDESDLWQRQIKLTHHVTEKRTRSLTRSLSDKFVEPLSSSSRSLNLSFLSELNPKKISKDWNSPYKSRFWDAFNDKENRKKVEKKTRRLSKQNTYVFQNIKRHPSQTFLNLPTYSTNSRMKSRLSQSVDNLESPTLIEVASTAEEGKLDCDEGDGEDHYSVIGEPPFKKEKSFLPSNPKGKESSVSLTDSCVGNSKSKNGIVPQFSREYKGSKGKDIILSESSKEPKTQTLLSDSNLISEGESVSVISVHLGESELETTNSLVKLNGDESLVIVENTDTTMEANKEGEIKEKLSTIEESNGTNEEDNINDHLSQESQKEIKGGIQMRGNTVVIKVKDFNYGKSLFNENDNESLRENEIAKPFKPNPQIGNNEAHVFRSTVDFSIKADKSIEASNDSKPPKYHHAAVDEERQKTTPNVKDLEEDSPSEDNHSKVLDKDISLSKLPEEANSVNNSSIRTPTRIKEGVGHQTEENNSKTLDKNKSSASYKMGVICNTLDNQQSNDNKTYFCITHDIPPNHIFHTIDLAKLENKDILLELTKSIENSKLNPIFVIKNEGNITFNCTEEILPANSFERPKSEDFKFLNVCKEANEEILQKNAPPQLPRGYTTQTALVDTDKHNECDSAFSVSSEELQEGDDVTHV